MQTCQGCDSEATMGFTVGKFTFLLCDPCFGTLHALVEDAAEELAEEDA